MQPVINLYAGDFSEISKVTQHEGVANFTNNQNHIVTLKSIELTIKQPHKYCSFGNWQAATKNKQYIALKTNCSQDIASQNNYFGPIP